MALGLEDRPGRHEQPLRLTRRRHVEAAEWRGLPLQAEQRRLAQQRQLGEGSAAGDGFRIDAGEVLRPAGRRHCARDLCRQSREQIVLAGRRVAGFKGVEVVRHEGSANSVLTSRCEGEVGSKRRVGVNTIARREPRPPPRPSPFQGEGKERIMPTTVSCAYNACRRGTTCACLPRCRGRIPSRPRSRAALLLRRPSRHGRSPGCSRNARI